MHSACSRPHPALAAHYASEFCQRAHFCAQSNAYQAPSNGRIATYSGLISRLRKHHYPHYDQTQSKRRWKKTNVRGSTSAQGKRVDAELGSVVAGKALPKRKKSWDAMTVSLLSYWRDDLGHTLEAAQVPVRVQGFWSTMTQADVITRDSDGRLWLWEVKTGMPVGFTRKKGVLQNVRGAEVPCNGAAVWHLQLHYTRKALEAAGVPIAESRVIQIHGVRSDKNVLKRKVHIPPEWVGRLREPSIA